MGEPGHRTQMNTKRAKNTVNIYDVAKVAGVSSATVSRVINGSPKVKPETVIHVQSVMNDLGFTPNVFARSLQSNSMKVLAVLTVDISDIYFSAAVQSIESYARRRGYDIQVGFARDDKKDQTARLRTLVEKRVDGIILAGSAFARGDNPYVQKAAKTTPIAILNGKVDGDRIYSVLSDDAAGIEMAVDHLVGLGRRNLVYVQDSQNPAAISKMRGYVRAVEKHGIEIRTIEAVPGVTGAYNACGRGLDPAWHTDGIVCAEDPLAIGAIKYLTANGRRVPEDVAVTGYDNLAFATCSTPELTSVDSCAEQMSETVARVLIEALEGGSPAALTHFVPSLAIRRSTHSD
ncbi:LacI family DNA-binding transcriptional regulator (plasmid) [Arthrobacter sp. UC242_113]|uniref:LacI family DNA-binding transcriptional regulator n=1 Tax=Arthrobacter sp. UC242_113 TaxID=3374550 RepID=UPI003757F45C